MTYKVTISITPYNRASRAVSAFPDHYLDLDDNDDDGGEYNHGDGCCKR